MTRYLEIQKDFIFIFLIVYSGINEFRFAVILMFENLKKLEEVGIFNCLFNLFRNSSRMIQRKGISLNFLPRGVKSLSHKMTWMHYYDN